MPQLNDIIKPSLKPALKKGVIPNFLTRLDRNKSHQSAIWSAKTYSTDPRTHVFTTIQEHFSNRLIHSLNIPKNGVVVDVGCFIGEKLWQIDKTEPYLGVGIDIAIPSLVAAKKIDIYGHKFIVADMENLPFRNNSVDLIMAFDVFEHLSHPKKGFSEVARVLKPGGQILLHTPIKDNKWSMFWWKQRLSPQAALRDYQDVGHTADRILSSKQILSSLRKNNLRPNREIYYNSFFVHFWDREFIRTAGQLLTRLSATPGPKINQARTLHKGNLGKMRRVYGRYLIPLLEALSFPDMLLSKLKVGNTYFVLATKD